MGRRFAGALIFIFGKLPVYPGTAHFIRTVYINFTARLLFSDGL